MAVDTSPRTTTWTYVDGEWLSGNPPLIGPTSHAMWLGSTVFDGARWFDGIAPDLDLHCQRVNRSAVAMGLKPVKTAEEIEALAWEGVKKFDGKTPIYIKPMYWGEHGSPGSVVAVDPESTRFALCLFEAPMGGHGGSSLTVSPFRRPSPETRDDRRQGRLALSEQRPHDPEAQEPRLRQCAGARHERQCRRDRLLQRLHGQGRRRLHAGRQPHLPRRHHPRPRHRPAAPGRLRRARGDAVASRIS